MATFNFPVPEGLLDLLRDFTVAVVQNEPDDLERFAAEYFTKLATSGEDDTASVECSKTRSLEFDESMYVTHVEEEVDELSSQKGSQSPAASSHASAASAEPPKEKCPDEAAKCWEKMNEAEKVVMKDCTAESVTESATKMDRVSSAVVRDGEVKEDTERGSTVRESAVGPNADDQAMQDSVKGGSVAEGSVAKESSVGRGSSLGRESAGKDPDDEVGSVKGSIKSAGSARLNENLDEN